MWAAPAPERRLRSSWWLLLGAPCVALAAEQTMRTMDAGEPRFWAAHAAVQVLALFGYASSSLPEWANWIDETGTRVDVAMRRLKILQGLAIALLAGNIAYYGGYYYASLAQIPCFIAVAVAAYGGDKFLTPLLTRITGKASGKE